MLICYDLTLSYPYLLCSISFHSTHILFCLLIVIRCVNCVQSIYLQSVIDYPRLHSHVLKWWKISYLEWHLFSQYYFIFLLHDDICFHFTPLHFSWLNFTSISNSQHQMSNALCNQSMEIFYECYGAEAGLAALKWLPYGGLYLTGTLYYVT